MMRSCSRQRATAPPRFVENTQKPPRVRSESAIRSTELSAIHPARTRSRSASPQRNPSTLARVLHEPAPVEHERAAVQTLGERRLVRRQEHGGAPAPDVLEEVEELGRDHLVQVEETEERGLARAARPAQHGKLALADPEAHVGKRRHLHRSDAEDLRYAVKLNHELLPPIIAATASPRGAN